MKIFSIVVGDRGPVRGDRGPTCRDCVFFENDPARIEKTYRGLTVFSSGFASVRDEDGFCNYHELYLSARDHCACFASRCKKPP